MGIFKNKVGRPSNDVKRKRKLIIILLVLLTIMMIASIAFVFYKRSNQVQISKTLNLSTEEVNKIKRQLDCKSGDTSVIKENEAYCQNISPSCPSGYKLTSDKTRCYKTECVDKGTYNTSTKKCTYSNPNYPCDKGYNLNKKINMCEKEVESAYTNEKIKYNCPAGYSIYFTSNGSIPQCRKTTSATTSYKCLSGWTKVGDGPAAYCSRYKQEKSYTSKLYTTSYSCNSGWTKVGDGPSAYCYKTESVKTKSYTNYIKSGFLIYTYKCPSGYTKSGSGSNTKCWKYVTKKQEKTSATIKKNTYFCPSGYNKSGSGSSLQCWKYKKVEETKPTTKTPVCPSGYLVDVKNNNCYTTAKGNYPTVSISYSCKPGYYKDNGTCYSRKKPSKQSVLTHTNTKKVYVKATSKTTEYNKITLTSSKEKLAIDTINKVWIEAQEEFKYTTKYEHFGEEYINSYKKRKFPKYDAISKGSAWCAIFMTYLQNYKLSNHNDTIADYVKVNSIWVQSFLEYFLNKTNNTTFHYNSYCSNYKSNYLNDKGYIPKVGDYAIVGNINTSNSTLCGKSKNNLLNGNGSIDCHAHIGIVQSVDTKNKTVTLLEGNAKETASYGGLSNNSQVAKIKYLENNDPSKNSEWNICKIVGFGSWY